MHPVSVILVNDDAMAIEHLTLHLESSGVKDIIAFHDPCKALQSIANGLYPRLLITDLQMCSMSGLELARQVALLSGRTKVIIFTGIPELVTDTNHGCLVLDKSDPESLELLIRHAQTACFRTI